MRRRFDLVFVSVLGFFLLSHGGHFYSVDSYTVYLTGNAFLEGRLDVQQALGTVVGTDGKHYGMYAPGLSLLYLPLSALGSALDSLFPETFVRLVGPGVSVFYPENFSIFGASLVATIFGALVAAEFWMVSELLGYSLRTTAALTILLVVSTQLWPSSRDSFPNVVVAFCLLACLGHIMTWQDARFRAVPFAAGCFAGLLVLVRPFDAALILPPILVYAAMNDRQQLFDHDQAGASRFVRFCVPIAVSAVLVALHNFMRFGDPLTLVPAGKTTIAFNHPLIAGMYGLLLSSHGGLLWFSPPTVATVAGLYFLARRRRTEAILIAALIAIFLVAYGKYALWGAGVSWGSRFLIPVLPAAILPLGALLESRRSAATTVVAVLAIAGFAVQVAGTSVDFHRVATSLANAPASASMRSEPPILLHWSHLVRLEDIDWMAWRLYVTSGWLPTLAYVLLPLVLLIYGVSQIVRELRVSTSR